MLYKSSKGDVEISTMPLSFAKNSLNKLLRTEPERTAEIEALQAYVTSAEAEATAKALDAAGEGKTGIDKFEARAKVLNERAAEIGDNGGPALDEPAPKLDSRKAIEAHVADLLEEARGCCLVIENEEQANVVGRLKRKLEQAAASVDDAATKEKKPHNDALAEIGSWQNSFTAKGLKKTPDGSLTKALLATSNLSTVWLRKLDEERKAREAVAAEVARKAAQEAIALRTEAKETTDTEVMDRADNALAEAQALIKQAVGVSKERVQSGGGEGFRAVGLRSIWSAVLSDEPGSYGLAYGHYKQIPEFMAEFHALIQRWADRDARIEANRVRGVPGFQFIEEKVAA